MKKREVLYSEADLQCCANCINYGFPRRGEEETLPALKCKENYIHEDLIKPWLGCEHWDWDQAYKSRRRGGENKSDKTEEGGKDDNSKSGVS